MSVQINNYSPKYNNHQHSQNVGFQKQSLSRYLSKHFIEAGISKVTGLPVTAEEAIIEVVKDHPKSRGFVGNLPASWIALLAKEGRKEQIQQIQDLFAELAKKICTPNGTKFNKDEIFITDFINKLKETLKTNANIEYIKDGSRGKAYKLTIGEDQFVFKSFHLHISPEDRIRHGSVIEPSRVPYAKRKESKLFTNLYFAKVATNGPYDGFILTKYENPNQKLTPHEEIKRLLRILKSSILPSDLIIKQSIFEDTNMINRRFIDLGALKLIEKSFNEKMKVIEADIRKYHFNTRKNPENKQNIEDKIHKAIHFVLSSEITGFVRPNIKETLLRLSDLIKNPT